jgi:hypothetical protein
MTEFFNIVIGIGVIFLIGRAYFRLRQGMEEVEKELTIPHETRIPLDDNHTFHWIPVHGPKELDTRILNHGDGRTERLAIRSEETKENGGRL